MHPGNAWFEAWVLSILGTPDILRMTPHLNSRSDQCSALTACPLRFERVDEGILIQTSVVLGGRPDKEPTQRYHL